MIKCYRNCEFVKHRECKAPFIVLFDKGDCNREKINKTSMDGYSHMDVPWLCKEKCRHTLKVKFYDGFVGYCTIDEITIDGTGHCEQQEEP